VHVGRECVGAASGSEVEEVVRYLGRDATKSMQQYCASTERECKRSQRFAGRSKSWLESFREQGLSPIATEVRKIDDSSLFSSSKIPGVRKTSLGLPPGRDEPVSLYMSCANAGRHDQLELDVDLFISTFREFSKRGSVSGRDIVKCNY
jgi:hypothetical protein